MARTKHLRKVVTPPRFKGYKPYGKDIFNKGKVELLYEEFEAIKLADYDLLNHQQACVLMGVSRPTFARIYKSARIKIATALVDVKEITTVYGSAIPDRNWFFCKGCQARFTLPETFKDKNCPLCKSSSISKMK
ncbi:MAG: DUF134 domain-containing protein [Bacteroidales bacterium]|nr:DUF134 domain-containing protein [Bacteroidales bacterium]MCF8402365.1 DUF134 domain-containing protein [Bacteroidales bacterium]